MDCGRKAEARQATRVSKTMALLLRHEPEAGGLTLDAQGWAALPDLAAAVGRVLGPGAAVTEADVAAIVAADAKGRYALEAGRVRANQGHSVAAVALDLAPVPPPAVLYHGTAAATVPAILQEGLKPMSRHHVHLSEDAATARTVGARHGAPAVLRVDAAAAAAAGQPFFRSANGVWLTAAVPPRCLAVASDP